MGHPKYSLEFKKSAVEKLLNRGTRPVDEILRETGISSPALYRWKLELANNNGMEKTSKRPQDRSVEEVLRLFIEYEKTAEDKRGEFLRKEGLHTEHIESWVEQIKIALRPARQTAATHSELVTNRRKIKDLEREIGRKDKALAEASALLILKKKAELIWGIKDNE